MSSRFSEQTNSLGSIQYFVFDNGNTRFAIQIASKYTNLTSLEITHCSANEFALNLSLILYELRNLTKLKSITILGCYFSAFGIRYPLDWMSNIRTINLACNNLDIKETVRFFGNQSSLSQLDTLILDNNSPDNVIPINFNTYILDANLFCNLSFSYSLRRWSFQRTGHFVYDAALTKCVPNLRSVSCGHNLFLDIADDGILVPTDIQRQIALAKSVSSIFYIKSSYLMSSLPSSETYCHSDDVTPDQYFVDETQFEFSSPICEPMYMNKDYHNVFFNVPLCLRGLQLDHFALNSEDNYIPPMNIRFSPNNSFELLDLSHSIVMVNGLKINAVSVSGLHKLRVLKLRHMNIHLVYMVTLHHADNLKVIDLSDNRLELMTAQQLSKIFTKPLTIHVFNLSACNIGELTSDFLHQFPRLTYLDLSYNKLSHLSLNLSWLIANDSLFIDLSFNQISTVVNSFVESIKFAEVIRPVTLNLNKNQFRCDCDTIAFIGWFQTTNVSIMSKEIITCNYRGFDTKFIISVDVTYLEFECSKFERILYISLSSVTGIAVISFITGVLLFKYRWHVRWHWFHYKSWIKRLFSNRYYMMLNVKPDFGCYINYLGVTDEWIMREFLPRIEGWDIGDAFVYARNGIGGEFVADLIMETINNSKILLYIIGNDSNAGEVQTFNISLKLSAIERLSDVIIVYKDLVTFEILQQRMPLLKSLCKPNRKYQLTVIQFEANDLFWPELQQHFVTRSTCMSDAELDVNIA